MFHVEHNRTLINNKKMVTLTQAKAFLRITYSIDDDYITDLIDRAQKFIEGITSKEYDDLPTEVDSITLDIIFNFYNKNEDMESNEFLSIKNSLMKYANIFI